MKQKDSQELLDQEKEFCQNWSQIEEMLHIYQDKEIDILERTAFVE